MIVFLARRFATMLVTLAAISVLIFVIINLPEGNYLSNQIAEMRATGEEAGIAKAEALMREYALDRPIWQQYLIWVGLMPGVDGYSGLLQGDLGWSFELDQPVSEVVGATVWMTVVVNFAALMFVYIVALPLGTIAAVRANRPIDYIASFVGYIGLATPNFLLALILLAYGSQFLDLPIGGLMAREYEGEPMGWDKFRSILAHLIEKRPELAEGSRREGAGRLQEHLEPSGAPSPAQRVRPPAGRRLQDRRRDQYGCHRPRARRPPRLDRPHHASTLDRRKGRHDARRRGLRTRRLRRRIPRPLRPRPPRRPRHALLEEIRRRTEPTH